MQLHSSWAESGSNAESETARYEEVEVDGYAECYRKSMRKVKWRKD